MEAYQPLIERLQEFRAVVPCLLLAACCVASWFPGHNARRWGHSAVWVVQRSGWLWCIMTVSASIAGVIDTLWPVLLLMWIALAAWSYGTSPNPLPAGHRSRNGFEVLTTDTDPALDDAEIPTAAIAS